MNTLNPSRNPSKLDPQTRKRIRSYLEDKIASLDDVRQQGKALTGPLAGLWRYRVGDYRIICEIIDQRLVVLVVKLTIAAASIASA